MPAGPHTDAEASLSVTQPGDPATEVKQAIGNAEHDVLLVDFDETLWLRNSTETYLRSARPRIVALVLLKVLDLVRPWALLPGGRSRFLYRDWFRVLTVTVLLPWCLPRWRRSAADLGLRWRNQALLDALVGGGTPLVVTFGFAQIVRPLLAGVDPAARLIVASSLLRGHRPRAEGKQAAARRELGDDAVAGALFVTDSQDDADLLLACRTPLLLTWPDVGEPAPPRPPYRPFDYTRKGKRAGQKYLLHNVVLEDVVVLGLAFAWLAGRPWEVAVGLLLLHLSFWLIYEIGYYDNDHVATAREQAPNHPPAVAAYAGSVAALPAWLTSLSFALPGCWLLSDGAGAALRPGGASDGAFRRAVTVFLVWLVYLACSRGAYQVYNRVPPHARGLPYAVLQLTRSAGYGVLLSTDSVGALLLSSLLLARWIPYLSYRDLGLYTRGSHRLTMLYVFLVLGAIQTTVDPHFFGQRHVLVALLYLVGRAHRPLRALLVEPVRS